MGLEWGSNGASKGLRRGPPAELHAGASKGLEWGCKGASQWSYTLGPQRGLSGAAKGLHSAATHWGLKGA